MLFNPSRPIFVRNIYNPIIWKGQKFSYNQEIPWVSLGVPEEIVLTWIKSGKAYHNENLEVQVKVGDRLAEMTSDQLKDLVDKVNQIVKDRSTSIQEFNKKKLRSSKIDDKQRGLIRRFLYSNEWIAEDFYSIRDSILDK